MENYEPKSQKTLDMENKKAKAGQIKSLVAQLNKSIEEAVNLGLVVKNGACLSSEICITIQEVTTY